ncbi:MAG: hypothetical protein ABIK85_08380 [Candidatus Eisenbacteria bacterium]
MKRSIQATVAAFVLLVLFAAPAMAGLVDFAVGAYGGMNLPLQDDASPGTVLGGKVRVLPPIPMVGFEVWYAHFTYEDPGEVLAQGDLSLALDGEGFDLWGVDALIGGVGGGPGFKWYGIVGVNAAEFEEFGKGETTRKLGGELGLGLEVSPPLIGLGFEARGMLLFPDLSGDFDETLFVATIGVNYYF